MARCGTTAPLTLPLIHRLTDVPPLKWDTRPLSARFGSRAPLFFHFLFSLALQTQRAEATGRFHLRTTSSSFIRLDVDQSFIRRERLVTPPSCAREVTLRFESGLALVGARGSVRSCHLNCNDNKSSRKQTNRKPRGRADRRQPTSRKVLCRAW